MIIKNITKTVWRTNAEKCCATWREDQLHGVIIVFQFSLSWELCRHLHVLPFVVIRVTAPGEQQQYTFCMWQVATVIHTQYTKDPPPTATASPKYCHISSTMVWVFHPVISSPEQRLMTVIPSSTKFYSPVRLCYYTFNSSLFWKAIRSAQLMNGSTSPQQRPFLTKMITAEDNQKKFNKRPLRHNNPVQIQLRKRKKSWVCFKPKIYLKGNRNCIYILLSSFLIFEI